MFIQISDNKNIVIPQGDILSFTYTIEDYNSKLLGADTYVLFSVYEPNQDFMNGVIRKKITKEDIDNNGEFNINITHEDTHSLHKGTYYYDIKLALLDARGNLVEYKTLERGRKFIIL